MTKRKIDGKEAKVGETTKKIIQAENTNQHQERRKNLDETTKKNI